MKLRFTTIEPLFETSALISRHRDGCMRRGLTRRVFDRLSLFGFGFTPEQLPNAYWVGERTVSIPLTPKLTDHEIERIIAAVRGILAK